MQSKLITPPIGLPVTRDELVKVHIKVDGSAEDSLLDVNILAAIQLVQNFLQRQLMQATYETPMDHWGHLCNNTPRVNGYSGFAPPYYSARNQYFTLPNAPLISIVSIKYDDVDGAEQTLDSSKYKVDTYSQPGKVFFTGDLPSLSNQPNCIRVQYVAGYGNIADDIEAQRTAVPDLAKVAILRTVADMYENRQDEVVGTSVGALTKNVEYLLSTIRLYL